MDDFVLTIKQYLENIDDEFFKEKYDASLIEECCKYIVKCVKESKRAGFCDDEIYKLARDYYNDHKGEKVEEINCHIVTNHQIELTEEEKENAHQEAIKKYQEEEYLKIKKQKEREEQKELKKQQKLVEKQKNNVQQMSLFEL